VSDVAIIHAAVVKPSQFLDPC